MERIFRVKYLLYLLVVLTVISCEKDSVNTNMNQINNYSLYSMIYPSSYIIDDIDMSSRVQLIYDKNNRVSERIGDFLFTSGIEGYAFKFRNDVKTVVKYANNIATIETRAIGNDFYVNPCKRTLFFDNDRLVMRVNDQMSPEIADNDTTFYFYDKMGKINRTKTITTYKTIESNFNYDENDNLQQVISTFSDKRGELLISKEIITFSDYDDANNLTKNLIIFEECFFRSLSRNNFRKYSREEYDTNNKIVYCREISFDLLYDEDDNPIY